MKNKAHLLLLMLTSYCAGFTINPDTVTGSIRASKDSLWVYNSNASSKADAVLFKNTSPDSIHLDSAHLLIDEMDTVGFSYPATRNMEVVWNENATMYPYFIWTMNSIGAHEFVLKRSDTTVRPLSFSGNGDTCRIARFSIGVCFQCNSMPRYPRYVRGALKLYFSSGQLIILRLYSDDLRPPITTSLRRGAIETCMWGDSLDFSLINDTCSQKKTTVSGCSFNSCSVVVPDIRITAQALVAVKGILAIGKSSDTNCLDTLKRAPISGYLDSVGYGSFSSAYKLFAVKTSENNYVVIQVMPVLSEMPFVRFKWIYQPDGTADFIKTTSSSVPIKETNARFRLLQAFSNRGIFKVSWTPIFGLLQFKLFDLKGRQLRYWECNGQHGVFDAPLNDLKSSHTTQLLQVRLRDNETIQRNCILFSQ